MLKFKEELKGVKVMNDKARITGWLCGDDNLAWLKKEQDRFWESDINTKTHNRLGLGGRHEYALFYTDGYYDTIPGNSHVFWHKNEGVECAA